MAPGASSVHDGIRDFYAPRITEPSTTKQRQSMTQAEHQKRQRPDKFRTSHAPADRPKKNKLLEEIENYKAGDEFVLLWKWVDDFVDKRRAKKKSSEPHKVNKSTLRQPKPTPYSSYEARHVPGPAAAPPVKAVRRQANDREDSRE